MSDCGLDHFTSKGRKYIFHKIARNCHKGKLKITLWNSINTIKFSLLILLNSLLSCDGGTYHTHACLKNEVTVPHHSFRVHCTEHTGSIVPTYKDCSKELILQHIIVQILSRPTSLAQGNIE